MRPVFVINFKGKEPERTIENAEVIREVAEAHGVEFFVCPQPVFLRELGRHGLAQRISLSEKNGHLSPKALKVVGARGSLVNHAESPSDQPAEEIQELKGLGLTSIFCTAGEIPSIRPDFIAFEPPQFIGKTVSAIQSMAKEMAEFVASSEVPVLLGAGVSSPKDVEKARDLGAAGVLFSSAFFRAKDRRNFLEKMFSSW